MIKSLTEIKGVYGSALKCGIKKDKLDLAYIYVPAAVASAAVYTKNLFSAPCVQRNRLVQSQTTTKAIIINSGNANVMTGPSGILANQEMANIAASLLELKSEEVQTASTGIIGVNFPIEKIRSGLAELLVNPHQRNGEVVAEAILTTDLVKKEIYLSQQITSGDLQLAGIAKGSGMIAPNMATMLSFLITNAAIDTKILNQMLKKAVDDSFNMISVDTDTSTSDQVVIIATGERKLLPHEHIELENLIYQGCQALAKKIARDGEGATKLIEVQVLGAKSVNDARRIAKNVAESPLIKTAVHGADPNWGRVIMAVGKDPSVNVDPQNLDLSFQDVYVLRKSNPTEVTRAELKKLLASDTIKITVNLNLGSDQATFWSCDLTKGYIDINVDYN